VRKDEALVFVEVKLRRGTGFGDPLEAVTPRKQHTLRSAAEHYLYTRKPHFDTLLFDVIGILADRPEVRVHHIEDAFKSGQPVSTSPVAGHLSEFQLSHAQVLASAK
jgi:putative endonuclease